MYRDQTTTSTAGATVSISSEPKTIQKLSDILQMINELESRLGPILVGLPQEERSGKENESEINLRLNVVMDRLMSLGKRLDI